MLEQGTMKRVVARAFDERRRDRAPGSATTSSPSSPPYRSRDTKVADAAGLGPAFASTGDREVVKPLDGIGKTDDDGISGRAASPGTVPMTIGTANEICPSSGPLGHHRSHGRPCLTRASKGPEAGAGARNGSSATSTPRADRRRPQGWRQRAIGRSGIIPRRWRDTGRPSSQPAPTITDGGDPTQSWPLAFLIRRCAWPTLDHTWEREDRDLLSDSSWARARCRDPRDDLPPSW